MAWKQLTELAKVLKIAEVNQIPQDDIDGMRLRLTGRLVSHDIHSCRAQVSDGKTTAAIVIVETSSVEPLGASVGNTVQVFGSMVTGTDGCDRLLRATIVRDLGCLDLAEWERALDGERSYLADRRTSSQATPQDIKHVQ